MRCSVALTICWNAASSFSKFCALMASSRSVLETKSACSRWRSWYDFDRAAVALLDVGLGDAGDRLALRHVVPEADLDRGQPTGRGRHGVDHATIPADQNTLSQRARRNPPDHAPGERARDRQQSDECQNPIERLGDSDEMIQLFRRGCPLQRNRPEYPLRRSVHRVAVQTAGKSRGDGLMCALPSGFLSRTG